MSDHDVNLNIRSTYQDTPALGAVTTQVRALTDALVKQAEASRNGDVTASQYNRTLQEATRGAQQLVQARTAILALQNQENRLQEANNKLADAKAKRDSVAASMPVDGATAAQTRAMAQAENAVTRLDAAVVRLSGQYDRAAANAERFGIDLFKQPQALREIIELTQQLGAARAVASAAEGAVAERTRERSDYIAMVTRLLREQETVQAANARVAAANAAAEMAAEEERFAAIERRRAEEARAFTEAQARTREQNENRAYVADYEALLKLKDQADATKAALDQMRLVAKEAVSASRDTAIRAVAPSPSAALAETTRSRVTDALGANTQTTAELQEQIARLSATLTAGGLSAREYADNLRRIRDANAELVRQAGVVDTFQRQNAQIAGLSRGVLQGQMALPGLQGRVDAATTSEEGQAASAALQAQVRDNAALAAQLERARAALVPLREEMQRLGIAETEVTAATHSLVASAGQARAAMTEAASDQLNSSRRMAADALERSIGRVGAARAETPPSATGLGGAAIPGAGGGGVGDILSQLPSRSRDDITDTAASLTQLQAVLDKGKISIHDYNSFMDQVYATGRKLAADNSLVARFQQQTAAVAAADAELTKMQAQLAATAAAFTAASAPSRELEADVRRDEAALNAAATALERERAALANTSAMLQRSGLDANNAAVAQAHLAAQAEKLVLIQKQSSTSTNALFGLDPYRLKILEDNVGQFITQVSLGQGVLRAFESQANQLFELFNVSIGALKSFVLYAAPVVPIIYVIYEAFQKWKENVDTIRQFNAVLAGSADGATTSSQALLEVTHTVRGLGASFDDARQAVTTFFRAGINVDEMERFGKAAQDLSDAYGVKFSDAVKEVTSGFTGNYDAVLALNKQYDFLTVAQAARIRQLFDEGHGWDANALAFQIFKDKQDAAAEANRTVWQVEVRKLRDEWDGFLQAVANILPFHAVAEALHGITGQIELLRKYASGEITLGRLVAGIGDEKQAVQTPEQDRLEVIQKERADLAGKLKGGIAVDGAVPDGSGMSQIRSLTPTEIAAMNVRIAAIDAEIKNLQGRMGGDAGANAPAGYAAMRDRIASQVGIDPSFFGRLQRSESGSSWNPDGTVKRSPTGPQGPLQLAQGTFDDMKRAHPDTITGDITDPTSNTYAGAYYARMQLEKAGGDPYKAVVGYHGPSTPAQQADAAKQASEVTSGYGGSPLMGAAAVSPAAPTAALVHSTQEMTIAQNALAEALAIETAEIRDRSLRGKNPETQKLDEDRINAEVLKKQRIIPDYQVGQNPESDAKLADYRAKLEKEASDKRTLQQKEIDDAAKAQQQKLIDALSSLKEAVDKIDKTNPVAARAAVNEARTRALAPIAKARSQGVTEVGGMSIDDLEKQTNALFDEKTTQAGMEADQQAVDKILAERKSAYDKLNADLKTGVVTIMQAFQQAADIASKFNPKIREAAAAAQADLRSQPQTPQVTSAEAKIAGDTSPAADAKENMGLVTQGMGQLEQLQKSRTDVVQQQKQLVAAGVNSPAQANQANQAAYDATAGQSRDLINTLQQQLDLMKQLQQITPAMYDEMTNKLKLYGTETTYVSEQTKELVKTIQNDLTGDATKAFDQIAQAVGKLITTHENFKAVIFDVAKAFDDFAADFIKQVAEMILKQELLSALQSTGIIGKSSDGSGAGGLIGGLASAISGIGGTTGGGSGGSWDSATQGDGGGFGDATQGDSGGGVTSGEVSSGVGLFAKAIPLILSMFHEGGEVTSARADLSRYVNPRVFMNARRFHDGATLGLAPDEVPAILQQGEQVLSKSQVRAAATAGTPAQGQSIRNVLAIGDKELASAMAGSDGEQVVLSHLKRNVPTLRNWLGVS